MDTLYISIIYNVRDKTDKIPTIDRYQKLEKDISTQEKNDESRCDKNTRE